MGATTTKRPLHHVRLFTRASPSSAAFATSGFSLVASAPQRCRGWAGSDYSISTIVVLSSPSGLQSTIPTLSWSGRSLTVRVPLAL